MASELAAAGAAHARPSRKLAYVHVPKTAGTSFTRALQEHWPRHQVYPVSGEIGALTPEEIDDLDMITGHFYAFETEAAQFQAFSRITLLRDPFERLFSSYRFARTYGEAGGPGLSLAMQYAGKVTFGEYAFSHLGSSDRHSQLFILGLNAGDMAVAVPLRRLMEQAKRRFDSMLVGTVDHLPEFLEHICRRHGFDRTPPIGRYMVSKAYALEEVGLTRLQQAALRELQHPDYELYEYARDLMLRRIEAEQREAA